MLSAGTDPPWVTHACVHTHSELCVYFTLVILVSLFQFFMLENSDPSHSRPYNTSEDSPESEGPNLVQGLANYGLMPVFVNKALVGHSHARSLRVVYG